MSLNLQDRKFRVVIPIIAAPRLEVALILASNQAAAHIRMGFSSFSTLRCIWATLLTRLSNAVEAYMAADRVSIDPELSVGDAQLLSGLAFSTSKHRGGCAKKKSHAGYARY